jgi:hypothetical protein
LTSDEHLREIASFEVGAPVIATPREIVLKFFRP